MTEPATKCECVPCEACGGRGYVWFDIAGNYLGKQRGDDLDQSETCEDCGGSGVAETCDNCQQQIWEDAEREEWQ